MRRQFFARLGALVITVVVARSALAVDVVYRKNVEMPAAQGQVTGISKTEVTVKPRLASQPPVTIPANEVGSIRWDGEPPALNLRRNDESGGRLQKALQGYQQVLNETPPNQTHLRTDLEFLIARTTAKMALTDPAKADEAVKALESFRKSHADSVRFYEALEYLGRVYLTKNNFDNARTVFDEMGQAPWDDVKMSASIDKARVLLAQNDVAGALSAFEAVIKQPADKPAEVARRLEAMLGKASCLQKQNQHGKAAKVLQEVIDQAAASNTGVQAEAYVRLGDSLRASGQPKEALLAYLHIDVLPSFAKHHDLHAEALYHLSNLWETVGKPGRAADAAARLREQYPNSAWTQKLTGSAQ